jgi:uncharacterized protein (TIGR03435 family)
VVAASTAIPAQGQSFDVASVKAVAAPPGMDPAALDPALGALMRFHGGPGSSDPGRIRYSQVTLKMLLERAYDLRPEQISGPNWIDSQRYVVEARLPPETTQPALKVMLQGLLSERFHIKLHRSSRNIKVYRLVVNKGTPTLKPARPVPEYSSEEVANSTAQNAALGMLASARSRLSNRRESSIGFHLPNATLPELAEKLSAYLDRPVLDRTQLTGRYEIHLRWVPDGSKPMEDGPSGPSIYVAIEDQLGLKLQSGDDQ